MHRIILIFFSLLIIFSVARSDELLEKYTISGYITDVANGEALIGATVYVNEIKGGSITNAYGYYSISLEPGAFTIEYRYVGYTTISRQISLQKNIDINIELEEVNRELEEVVILAEKMNTDVESVEMSVNKLDIKTIQRIPALLGEVDIIKSIQLLPGVSTVGEGASGFNVRGGSVGQNLVLLDEAPVYNSSHLLGFFSVFNPDAVKDVKLYKGGIPAQYGGRISSILDIRMKEGNQKKFATEGGIGTIFSRLTLEAPIVKDRSSFVVAGRRSYIDVLAKPFTDVLDEGAQLYFYDLTLKSHYDFSQKDQLYISGYFGKDVFKFDAQQGFSWGNSTATLRWNHLFDERLFFNLTGIYSDYDYNLAFGENDLDKFEWESRIRTISFKPRLTFFLSPDNAWDFGGEFNYYRFNPANAYGISNGEIANITLDKKFALESALYLSNEVKIGPSVGLQYGLRFSGYMYLGPGSKYEYGEAEPGKRKPVTSVETYDDFEVIQDYNNLEPRLSFRFQMNGNSSLKVSYNRIYQYIHLISNTTASNPLDVWTPSTNNIEPQRGDQYALGFFRNFGPKNDYESSVELYYRDTKNQIEYIDGADLLINEYLEGDLLSGIGRAYGAEFYFKKNTGKFNGWISYTIGKTELKVDGINNGEWYPTRFDQLHNLKIAAFYDINPRWTLSANFIYLSGTPTTFPTSRYNIQEYLVPYIGSYARNNIRIPDYHRLDISATLYGKKYKKNGERRKNEDYWVFGVYNLYARRNPFSIYFSNGVDRPVPGEPISTTATRVSVIGTIIPAVSYNFKF
ncbi:MAG: carboxypeptidase-like regulatory domain-containing protein [Cyclobacteriaceae bacterium]|nr:carboxypeptidase-like regulatory domain-containing protein [Cyclobacteriaceae bacterium]